MVTGKLVAAFAAVYQRVAVSVAFSSLHCLRAEFRGASAGTLGASVEEGINAVKRSAVSTGRLRRLLVVHVRPIDLVVFQEPV